MCEPARLGSCLEGARFTVVNSSDGWAHHKDSKNVTFFIHTKDAGVHFNHPVPLVEHALGQCLLSTPAYLTCCTTTASFAAATVLKERSCSFGMSIAIAKISVFENRTLQHGPDEGKTCPILVLQRPDGGFGGLLRMMGQEEVNEDSSLELVGISTGSAKARDLRRSLEWKVFETGIDRYEGDLNKSFRYEPEWISNKGKYALLFNVAMAFDKEVARNESLARQFDEAFAGRKVVARDPTTGTITLSSFEAMFGSAREFRYETWFKAQKVCLHKFYDAPDDFDCEFYNVLWIERSEGVAYRRACGWVPKHIWEAYSVGPVEIKLSYKKSGNEFVLLSISAQNRSLEL